MSFLGNVGQYIMGEDWDAYVERLEQFMLANAVDDNRKVAVFISVIGQEAYSLLRDLCSPVKPSTKSYNELIQCMEKHLKPKVPFIAERYKFRQRVQKSGETLLQYLANLKKLAKSCDFGPTLEEALRDQFVCGLQNEAIRRRLLQEANLTYNAAFEIATSMESAFKHSVDIAQASTSKEDNRAPIDKLRLGRSNFNVRPSRNKPSTVKKNPQHQLPCGRCGANHNERFCPAKSWTCYSCKRKGHLAKCCRTLRSITKDARKLHQLETMPDQPETSPENEESSEEEQSFLQSLHVLEGSQHSYEVDVTIEGVSLKMELDTGAAISIIPESMYYNHFKQIPLKRSTVTLKTYTGETLAVKGTINVQVVYDTQRALLPLAIVSVVGTKVPALFGRNWLEELKLNWNEILNRKSSVNVVIDESALIKQKEDLLQKFPDVFKEGNGCIQKYKAHISLKENAVPVFAKARPVPLNLRDRVAKELERLESEGIIERVTKSEWATPLVVVPKDQSKLRLCGDYSITVNPVCRTDHYPLPNTEELFASLVGGKVFTKLDLTNAYQQLELTESSASLLTVNTHLGLFRYKRMPFGISSAPAIFQSIMDQILRGLQNVYCYLDDVLITGQDLESCKNRVVEVLKRLSEHHIRVNLRKCIFFQNSVEYLGHKIDHTGIHPTEAKIRAIREAPEPKNVSQLRSFLGLINYYRRFVPNLATLLHPLYELLQVDKVWKWTKKCQEAFMKAKEEICSDKVLVHYDSSKPVVLTCDASTVGLGAVLSHIGDDNSERPIGFVSRTLTAAEVKYAQIEKEAAAIIFGVQKFHRFLYGRKFTLVTDHKPLTRILGPTNGIPTIAAARLQRWAIILSAYQYDIQYREGPSIGNADALSRLPVPTTPQDDSHEERVNYFAPLRETPLVVLDIARATRRDSILARVLDWTRYGWPNEKVEPEFIPYSRRKDELSVEQDCLTWGSRVIIPDALREQVLQLLHEEHPGMVRMKMLARSFVWWPNLDQQIENLVRSCPSCQAMLSASPVGPLHPWIWAISPWERIHLDIAFIEKFKFLIICDSFSKWIEVQEITSLTSEKVIEVLHNVFAHYGLPQTVVHDNGRQFTSEEFKQFVRENGIKDICTPIFHPASNGAAERAVQTVKRALKKLVHQEQHGNRIVRSLQDKVDSYLFSYRATPQTTTGQTPAELFLKRQLRTRITLLKPSLNNAMRSKTSDLKQSRDEGRGSFKSFSPGEKVYVRSFDKKGVNWVPGLIIQHRGNALYLVKLEKGSEKVIHVDHIRRRAV